MYPECEGCQWFENGYCEWYGQDADSVRHLCDKNDEADIDYLNK